MTIGCDIDGVVTVASARVNFRLPWWLFYILAFVPLAKEMVQFLIGLSANHKIVFISSRPRKLNYLTQWWFNRKHVPYSSIFLVGLEPDIEQRKLEVILREKIDIYFDDDEKIVAFLRERGIAASKPADILSIPLIINAFTPKGVFLETLTPFFVWLFDPHTITSTASYAIF